MFPVLGRLTRWIEAAMSAIIPTDQSYSQHGEDTWILKEISNYDLINSMYVDVGANQPAKISNTYLFYRIGLRGISIDANEEMIGLHRRFRPHDISICCGCGSEAKVEKFTITKVSVLSGFGQTTSAWHTLHMPILTLDQIMASFKCEWIFFLSVDVEGMDYAVLRGSSNTLKKSLFASIEANSESEGSQICEFMQREGFRYLKTFGCNLMFKNEDQYFGKYLLGCRNA